jgi:RNA polymerase sigma-70 factor (ECF subfamily)
LRSFYSRRTRPIDLVCESVKLEEEAKVPMDNASKCIQLSDEKLALEAAAGSRASFEELIHRYSPRLFFFLRHKTDTDQDIEDLIQETFLKAFRNIDRFEAERKFSTWLYTIAVRSAISHHRIKKATRSHTESISPLPDPQDALIQKEESRNIWNLARRLKPMEYEALWLHYGEDMSVKDIAKVIKKTQISVRVLLHRARLNLARMMSKSSAYEKLAGPEPVEHKFSFL